MESDQIALRGRALNTLRRISKMETKNGIEREQRRPGNELPRGIEFMVSVGAIESFPYQ